MSTEAHISHPSTRQYVQIAVILAVLTAIEVGLFYLDASLDLNGWDAPMLVTLSTIKFVMVVGWFMHLRFEKGLLSKFFGAGFALAMGLYLILLAALGVLAIRG